MPTLEIGSARPADKPGLRTIQIARAEAERGRTAPPRRSTGARWRGSSPRTHRLTVRPDRAAGPLREPERPRHLPAKLAKLRGRGKSAAEHVSEGRHRATISVSLAEAER